MKAWRHFATTSDDVSEKHETRVTSKLKLTGSTFADSRLGFYINIVEQRTFTQS